MWCKYRDAAQKVAEEVCGVSRGKPQYGETWGWNQDVQDAITNEQESFRKWRNRHLMKTSHVIKQVTKKEAEKELDAIENSRNLVFRKLRMLKKDSCGITGSNCLKGPLQPKKKFLLTQKLASGACIMPKSLFLQNSN